MAITILAPAPPPTLNRPRADDDDGSDSEGGAGVDLDGDADMLDSGRPSKRARRTILTPGQVVTDDAQWMR